MQHPSPPRLNLAWDLLRALSGYLPWRCNCQLTSHVHLKDCSTHAPLFHASEKINPLYTPPCLKVEKITLLSSPLPCLNVDEQSRDVSEACHGRFPIACVMLFQFSTLMPGGIERECCCSFKLLLVWATFFNIDYGGGGAGGQKEGVGRVGSDLVHHHYHHHSS